MKAVRVTLQPDGTLAILPLPLPSMHRKGETSADRYRKQSTGEMPRGNTFDPIQSDFLRAIALSEGKFTGLAGQPGSLLSIVLSGDLTLVAGPSQTSTLEAGDILLTDGDTSSQVTLDVRSPSRLVQIGVNPDFPGPDAKIQPPGTINPRAGSEPNIKRIYKGEDDRAYFTEFAELFPSEADKWSTPRRISGFRMLYWEDGWTDYHPCVISQIGIFSSGELEMEVGGGGGAKQIFRAGDLCLAEDRTGEGHLNRIRGGVHSINIVIETEDLWPYKP